MAAGGSTWSDSQKDEIIRIAESAIETITQLSNVVGRSNPAPAPSNLGGLRSENSVEENKSGKILSNLSHEPKQQSNQHLTIESCLVCLFVCFFFFNSHLRSR